MTHYQLGTYPPESWDGELAEEVTTRTDDKPRWVEFRVYSLDDGTWLSHRAGMSLVYHQPGTKCRTITGQKPGKLTTAARLPADAEPCEACDPPYPDELDDGDKIRAETPRHTVDRAATAGELVEILTTARNRETGLRIVKVSEPVGILLDRLAQRYEAFAAVMRPRETVIPVLFQGGGYGAANT